MFRITRIADDETSVTLRVEGRLVGRWIDELETECERHRADRRRVKLDLSGVTFVDDRGIEALRSMAGHHVEVVQCSLFLSGLLKRA